MRGLLAYKQIGRKKGRVYTKYRTLFPLSGDVPNAPVSFSVTCSKNSSIKKWWKWFSFSVLSSTPPFLSRLVSHINNSSNQKHVSTLQNLVQKSIRHWRKSNKTHLLKRISLHREKDQTNNFSPFLYKSPFGHRKEFLKSSQFHLKGIHFKSTSSNSFSKVWWKSRIHSEIRNPSET